MTGIDLEATPPCEIFLGVPHDGRTSEEMKCGKPSFARLRIMMPCCGARYIRFVCQQCLSDLGDHRHVWICEEGCNVNVRPEWTVI